MKNRRDFFKTVAAAGVLGAVNVSTAESFTPTPAFIRTGPDDRKYWVSILGKLANPVLGHLAKRELRKVMPVETSGNAADRSQYTHLEAFGRLLAGMSPWLGTQGLDGAETALQNQFIELAHRSLEAATDPVSPDFMNFMNGGQPLVDTAFLAQAILRAPSVLWDPLETRVKKQVVDCH